MRRILPPVLALVFSAFAIHAVAQAPARPDATTQPSIAAEAGPVTLPPPSEMAVRFYESGIALWLAQIGWEILVPAVVVFTGFSARIRKIAQFLGRKWFFTVAIYGVIFSALLYIANLPLDFYAGYVRLHAYGISTETLAKWRRDSLLEFAISTAGTALLLWIPYLLVRKSPKRWWLYTGLLVYVFIAFNQLIQPTWIDPLFNDFTRMKDKALETKILALADRAGIEGGDVFEVDKSVETKAYDAYVTGIFHTKRIVLWDTIIKGFNEDELLFVMAHEMGHYALGHVYMAILFFGTLFMIGLYAIHRSAGWVVTRYKNRLGFDEVSDVASYPLVLVLLSVTTLVLQPAAMAFSRHLEHESDRFGLELVQNNHAAATAFVKLFQENLGYPNPHPLVKLWRSSHPTLTERIGFCNTYRPWETGAPLKYGHLFKPLAEKPSS